MYRTRHRSSTHQIYPPLLKTAGWEKAGEVDFRRRVASDKGKTYRRGGDQIHLVNRLGSQWDRLVTPSRLLHVNRRLIRA